MRKLLGILILLLAAVLCLSACGVGSTECEHASMSEWKTEKATCTMDGSRTRFCYAVGCDYVETEKIPKLGHNIQNVPAVEATCTEAGYTEYSRCLRCAYQTSCVQTPKLDHVLVKGVITTAPTCTAEGKQIASCENCNYTENQDVPMISHTEAIDAAVDPTCTASGLT